MDGPSIQRHSLGENKNLKYHVAILIKWFFSQCHVIVPYLFRHPIHWPINEKVVLFFFIEKYGGTTKSKRKFPFSDNLAIRSPYVLWFFSFPFSLLCSFLFLISVQAWPIQRCRVSWELVTWLCFASIDNEPRSILSLSLNYQYYCLNNQNN